MSTKLERIIWIDREIRAGRYPNARRVQAHFELRSNRVVYEDRRFMIDRLGAPIEYSRAHSGWYYADPNYSLPALILTREEVMAFFLGEELFRRYLGTPFEQPLRTALSKIGQYLPDHVGYDIEAEASTFAFTGGSMIDADPELVTELQLAITTRHQLEILYYSASSDKLSKRVVDPYHLHNVRGDWYLIAFCHRRSEVRDFLVGRIRKFTVLHSTFQVRTDFSLTVYLGEHFLAERGEEPVNVVIRFDEYQARWIRERQWHSSQKMEELPSGELILRLKVGGLQEVKRWIMGYGPHAEILEPAELRAQFMAEVAAMKKIYDRNME